MFVNSLFFDYLIENGMRTWKDESTRDIICLEFNYGSRSYYKELDHLRKIAKIAHNEYRIARIRGDKYLITKASNKRKKISDLLNIAHQNRDKYNALTNEELRTLLYNNGIDIKYTTRDKKGKIKKEESIHYKMLYRSTGKAKKGTCMFIRDKLYKKARNFLYMGIELSDDNPMIVEVSAYAPLVSSGIVGKIKINPKNILILKDVDRFFNTNVVSIETDDNKHCKAKRINNYELKNTLFDGQALIDSSIFPDWGNGYILLRHHFCKMAAFSTNVQQFFKDYFGNDYYTATVKDMFGNDHYVKDIELITTDNSMKWLKFGKTYDYWCKWVYDNGCQFGIVKTAHQSKLGNVQKMSYQMINSLDINSMDSVVKESVNYINRLKTDDSCFFKYLEKNSNFSNDFEVLIKLCEYNPDFIRSSYFRRRRSDIIKAYTLNFKSGKVLQNAENLVVVGSPYAMLLYSATGRQESVDEDNTFFNEKGTIQCYTERFNSGEYLAFFRSPFNSRNNLLYLHNIWHKNLEKYFNFGKQVIAMNMVGTDAQDRANGMDMDSDSGYTTNQPLIVEHARYCYLHYPTIVNNIPKDKNTYHNTMDDFALVDNMLSASQLAIGESSNLAQICLTYTYNFNDPKYDDYVCILSVVAQAAIDNAKRQFDIDIDSEIKRIKKDMNIKENGYPEFWKIIRRDFNKNLIRKSLDCPMNYLYNLKFNEYHPRESTLPMSYFFVKSDLKPNYITCKKVEELISKYSLELYQYNSNQEEKDVILLRSDFEELLNDLRRINISNKYWGLFSWLIDRAFMVTPQIRSNMQKIDTIINKNLSLLIKVLYELNQSNLLRCFSKNDKNASF